MSVAHQFVAGSTSRARALSQLWTGAIQVGRQISSTSRARALSLFGALLVVATVLVTTLTAGSNQAYASTSSQLNFQGRLLTSTGGLVPDGTYNIEFNLYYVPTAGSPEWTETRLNNATQGVTVRNGYFSVYLGDITTFPSSINWSEDLYLGMTVRGTGSCAWGSCMPADSEMTPRFKMTSVPYAFRAANVASSGTNQASTNSDAVSITTGDAQGATSNSGNISIDTGTATGTTGTISLGSTNASGVLIGRAGVTTTLQGSVVLSGAGTALSVTNNATIGGTLTVTGVTTATGGLTVGTGSNFINQGSTLFTSIAISNLPTGGVIGTAAATVDAATTFNVNQTTAGQALTLPSPTTTTSGRLAFINNIGITSFTMFGNPVAAGSSTSFIWNGTDWVQTISFTSTGVETIGALDSQIPSADGAVIVGTSIYLQSASASNAGLVNTAAQTFVGVKTFENEIIGQEGLTVSGATINLNASSNFNTNINTGTSTGTVVIGNSASTTTVLGTTNINTTGSATTSIGNSGAVLTLSGSSILLNSATLQRTASGTTTLDLVDGANTTLALLNSGAGVANLTVDGSITVATLGSTDNASFICRNTANILSGCNYTPLNPNLTDNIADALDIQEGTNNYININTTNGSENISFGNTTTNPSFNLLGSGTFSTGTGAISLNGATSITGSNTLTVGTGLTSLGGALTVTGLTTLNGGLTVLAGQNFTFNTDVFTDFTGGGLVNTGGVLTVDATSATGFFQNDGNSFGAVGTIGTNDGFGLSVETNNTVRASFANGNILYLGNADPATGLVASPNAFSVLGTSNSTAAGVGGAITLQAGAGNTSGAGGLTTINGGVAGATGIGGGVTIRAGAGGATSGVGGAIVISSGAGTAGNSASGAITISTASAIGVSTSGSINLTVGQGLTQGSINLATGQFGGTYGNFNIGAVGGRTQLGTATSNAKLSVVNVGAVYDADSVILGQSSATQTGNLLTLRNNALTNLFVVDISGNTSVTGTLVVTTLGATDNASFLCRNLSNQLAGCNFTPLSSSLTDNIVDALDIQEGTNNYININTTNGSENISFGNATTNPSYNFLGSGTLTVSSATTVNGLLTGTLGATVSGADINLNASSNFDTNINTGTSTGSVNIGNALAGAIELQSASTFGVTANTSILASTGTGVALTVNNGTSTGDILRVQDNGTSVFVLADGGAALFRNTANSTTALRVQNVAGANVFTVDTDNALVQLGDATTQGRLVLSDGSSNTLTLQVAALAGNYTLTVPTIAANDTFCLVTLNNCDNVNAFVQGGNSFTATGVLGTTDDFDLNVITNNNIVFSLSNTGQATFQNSTDSATAFRVLNQAGATTVLNVNTTTAGVAVDGTLSVTGRATLTATGGNALAVTGMPVNTSTLSLVRIGNAISGGNINTNGGTFIGINAPAGGVGSTADFVNFQNNGQRRFRVLANGGVTAFALGDNAETGSYFLFNATNMTAVSRNASNNVLISQGATSQTGDLFQLQNSSSSVFSGFNASGNLFYQNSTFTSTILSSALTANRTITLPNASGTILLDSTGFMQGGNTFGATAVLGTTDNFGLNVITNNNTVASFSNTGAATLQNSTDSASAFRINNAAGSALLEADTTNYLLKVAPTQFLSSGSIQDFAASGTLTGIDSYSTIAVNATVPSTIITLPVPAAGGQVVGRVIYVTAVNASNDFTLRLGGTLIDIGLKANSTATLIWNGTGWTAAGASSSTDLQSAYNNTLTSAGGAELVLNAPGGAADGLTIRNNPTTPIVGGLLEVQTSVGSNLFSVNNNAVEYASNGGAETLGASASTFPANTWSAAPAGGTVGRYTTIGDYIATGQASVSVVTGATADHGVANRLTTALTPNLRYSVSFAVRGTTAFNTLDVSYSPDGTATGLVTCTVARTVTQGAWTRVICNFDAPASGITANNALLIRQSDATARTFYIENLSVTVKADVNHAVDGSVDDTGNFTTNWTAAPAGGSVTRDTTIIYDTSGSARVTTTATVGHGITNNMSITPTVDTQYLVTFYARSTNTFDDIRVRYSRDGGTNFVSCVDYNTRDVSTVSWTRITCLFTTDGIAPTDADLVIDQPTAVARDFWVDGLSITLNTNTASNVQIGGGALGGPTTLLTLDRSAGPPVAANNDSYLGSMYYDTLTGRIQCYESGGWGTCGSPPDNIVNLNPEYAGSVLNGTGVGTMTADVCANEAGVLQVNTTLCASGEARNFYRWTSPQATQQTYSIYVTYQLPSTFDGFANDDTVQLTGRVDNITNAAVTYQMFRSENGSLTQCGTGETNVATTANTWQTVGINGNEATGCGFTSASANAFVLFKLNLKANSNASAYVSTLAFTTTGR